MNLFPALHFHTRNNLDPSFFAQAHDHLNVSCGIVVRNGDNIQALEFCPLDNIPGRKVQTGARGQASMNVQIGMKFPQIDHSLAGSSFSGLLKGRSEF
jgi:hypothetical protein